MTRSDATTPQTAPTREVNPKLAAHPALASAGVTSTFEYDVLDAPSRSLRKYVFIQDEPFFQPKVLDKYLWEFSDSTVGCQSARITGQ